MNEDIIAGIESVETLKEDWALLLVKAGQNNLFLTWEWINSWCQNMLGPTQQPFIITARENNRLIGLAPLVRVQNENAEWFIQFLGQSYSYHLDFIAEAGREEQIFTAIWDYLLKGIGVEYTAVEFIHLEEDARFESVLKTLAQKKGLWIERSIQNTCKVLDLPTSFEEYLKSGILSRNLRHNLKKDSARLKREYEVEFFQADMPEIPHYWSELLKLHRQMMQMRNRHSILMGNSFPAHLQQVAGVFQKQKALRLSVMKVNQETAAVLLGIIHNNVYNALTMAVDQLLIRKMPWLNFVVYMQARCIQSAIENGCRQFDFLGGHNVYKYKLGGKDKAGIKYKINGMKPSIAIITNSFFNPKKPAELTIGGVETWLLELIRLLVSLGFTPVVYQTAVNDFKLDVEGAEVIGLGGLNRHRMNKLSHRDIDQRNIRWIIYASSFVGEKYFRPDNIFIQHGIHWDYTMSQRTHFLHIKWEYIRRILSRHDLKMCRKSHLTITVDSNFLNYSRIMLGHRFDTNKIRYIPNFAIPQEKSLWHEKWMNPKEIHVVFARRFELRRGVILFAEAIEQILSSAPKVRVTFAGYGTYEKYILEKFGNSQRVTIEAVPHDKMYELLNRSHIAVIPSTYSEGTSLSCLEAMAAGCAVVATDIGGLCNIVIPDFNGILVRPNVSDIVLAVSGLVNDIQRAETLANRGYDMIGPSFSLSTWRNRIKQALNEAGVLNF